MFKIINNIEDIRPAVADLKEIRFLMQPNGITIACYMFMDSKTFLLPEAKECRGIAFDQDGNVVSRPLHKFFNIGEKEWLTPECLLQAELNGEIAAIYEKVDGSMIATSLVDGKLMWRSKKAYHSDVVKLANEYSALPENKELLEFADEVAHAGMTAIFEITHPQARIVVAQDKPNMQLLHVRNNLTGEYVMLDPNHKIHSLIAKHNVHTVRKFEGLTLSQMLDSLANMTDQEGYVVQFKNGDMVKIKCPWYLRFHRSITFLRERDIAVLSLHEELDDVKATLTEAGIDLSEVEGVETRLKSILSDYLNEIESIYALDSTMIRKDFAIKYSSHKLFGMLMGRYLGKEVLLADWYEKNHLKADFSLRVLASGALADAIEG